MLRREVAPGVALYRVRRTDWGAVRDAVAGRLALAIGCAATVVMILARAA